MSKRHKKSGQSTPGPNGARRNHPPKNIQAANSDEPLPPHEQARLFGQGSFGQGWLGHSNTPGYAGYFGGFGYGPPYIETHHSTGPYYGVPSQATDGEIEQMICTALENDPHVPHDSEILVRVAERVVTLTGTVRNRRAKLAAGHDAWHCPGVEDVHNTVRIVGRHRPASDPPVARPNREPPPDIRLE